MKVCSAARGEVTGWSRACGATWHPWRPASRWRRRGPLASPTRCSPRVSGRPRRVRLSGGVFRPRVDAVQRCAGSGGPLVLLDGRPCRRSVKSLGSQLLATRSLRYGRTGDLSAHTGMGGQVTGTLWIHPKNRASSVGDGPSARGGRFSFAAVLGAAGSAVSALAEESASGSGPASVPASSVAPGRGTGSGYSRGSSSSSRCSVAVIQFAAARWSTAAASR